VDFSNIVDLISSESPPDAGQGREIVAAWFDLSPASTAPTPDVLNGAL
jgi:hypothetical protein